MSQRSTSPLKRSTVRRTLQRFWDVTRTQPLIVFLSVFSSAGYIFLLTFANTYVMALIVDRVQAGPVAGATTPVPTLGDAARSLLALLLAGAAALVFRRQRR